MIGTLIQIIFAVIIMGVIWWAIQQLLPHIPMGEPFRSILRVLMIVVLVIIILWIIWQLLLASGIVSGRSFRLGATGEPGGAATALSAAPARHLPWVLIIRSDLTAPAKIIPKIIPAFYSYEQIQRVMNA